MSEPEIVASDSALIVLGPPQEPADAYNASLGAMTFGQATETEASFRENGVIGCACVGCPVRGCDICICSHLRAQRTALMDAGSIVARLVRDRIDQKLDEREAGQ